MATDSENNVDIEDVDSDKETISVAYSITAYGADYPVESIVRKIERGDIVVPTFEWKDVEQSEIVGFQRDYVWPRSKADKFIESLLLGLPVPGIFLVKEDTGRFLVLDGHQRLHTLHSFYRGVIGGQEFRLKNVNNRFDGKTYEELEIDDRRRLDDSVMHSTIVRQDEPSEDHSSIYVIFERLNTGGVNLQPMEIRVALYHGRFVELLARLNQDKNWRQIFGKRQRRLKDMELILRFFALLNSRETYASPMKDFLNKYMAHYRDIDDQEASDLESRFSEVIDRIKESIGAQAFRPKGPVNAAVMDSVMVAMSIIIHDRLVRLTNDEISDRYFNLLDDKEYQDATETGTSQIEKVRKRIDLALRYLGG